MPADGHGPDSEDVWRRLRQSRTATSNPRLGRRQHCVQAVPGKARLEIDDRRENNRKPLLTRMNDDLARSSRYDRCLLSPSPQLNFRFVFGHAYPTPQGKDTRRDRPSCGDRA